jgi:hypothetical protein
MGLDCSELVFAHCSMMPLSFMVDEDQGLVGITFWETAGFIPKEWIRTISRANSFMDSSKLVRWRSWSELDKYDWEIKTQDAMEEKGFVEQWEKHGIWRHKNLQRWEAELGDTERRKDA